jgi:release factor glutamine methyltransferase
LFQSHALPRLEQLALAAWALNKPRSWLLAHDTDALEAPLSQTVQTALARRVAGEPVAYIVGSREFYGLNFQVSPAVLIPRAETELLVDWLIAHSPKNAKVLDLGTGSGAIAIALASQRADVSVFAGDISDAALMIARYNNTALVQGRVHLRCSDWLSAFQGETFEVIVSNPPYIAADDTHLSQGDLRCEPAGALTDFDDGFKHYRHIAMQAKAHLSSGGKLVLEHGWQQSKAIIALLETLGYSQVTQHFDAASHAEQGHPRMITATLGN